MTGTATADSARDLLVKASEAVTAVLAAFPVPPEAPWGRPRPEITARALLLSGRVRAAGADAPGAQEHLDAAAELYPLLGDERAAAVWESLGTALGSIPPGLLAAAETVDAEKAAVVQALRRHTERGAPGDGPAYWQGAV